METNSKLDNLFFALADSNRRQILNLISEEAMTIGELASHLNTSLVNISKNVKILEKCALIYKVKKGRSVYCHMNFDTWIEVAKYISMVAQFWNKRLNELEKFIVTVEE